jgi:hypothetical protein
MAARVMASVIPWLEEDQSDTAARMLVSLLLRDSNSATRKAAYATLDRLRDKLLVLRACMEHHRPMLDALNSSPVRSQRAHARVHTHCCLHLSFALCQAADGGGRDRPLVPHCRRAWCCCN